VPVATVLQRSVMLRPGGAGAGFSLLELMLVMAVALTLVALALPSWRGLLERWTLRTEAQTWVDDLRYARAQAIGRAHPVSICPSVDGSRCASHADWASGWLVFLDPDANRVVDSGERVLRQHQPDPALRSMTSNATTRPGLTYQPTGMARAAGQTLRLSGRGSPPAQRLICVSMQGRAALQAEGATSCS
jgi:type IV fimbrial biogenesis protein FimT